MRLSLRAATALFVGFLAVVSLWTWRSSRETEPGGRQHIVFWSNGSMGEDIYGVLDSFEKLHPEYRVTAATATARDLVGDAQRLLSAIAGGVPPDLVFFDRFAIGEWASKRALEDLTPYLQGQDPADPNRIDFTQYYPWAVDEASYRPPGSTEPTRVYGVPMSADIRLLFSNLDLLRQEGIVDAHGDPKPPTTWEELRAAAKRLNRYRVPGDMTSGLTRLGFAPNYGNSYLYMFAFQSGGSLLSADGLKVTMSSPKVVRALRFMTDVYDDLGGAAQANALQQSFQGGPLDPFIRGQVAMMIHGDWYLETLGDWKPEMSFSLTPAPMPEDELANGRHPITWAGGWALVIPTTAQHKKGAFELIQYLRSWDVVHRLADSTRERKHNEGRMYLPRIDANRVFTERLFREGIGENPSVPKNFKSAFAALESMLGDTLIRPVSPIGQLLWGQHIRAYDAGVNHRYREEAQRTGGDEIEIALSRMQEPAQHQLDELTRPEPPHVVGWTPYAILYCVAIVVLLGAIVVVTKKRRSHGYRMREVSAAMFFASPWFLGFAVLTGGPILFSIVLSFARYDVLTDARYVGLANYGEVLRDPVFLKSLLNTAFMMLRIPLVMAAGLAIAMLLNSGVRGIGGYRTGIYLPAIMPVVATSLLWVWIMNPSQGFLNEALRWCFDTAPARAFEWVVNRFTSTPFRLEAPLWLQDPRFSKPALIVMNLWTAGGSMIIWLAGLQSIPRQLYEAASIDGAGAWRRFWHVTIPMLSPYILFNLIMGIIGTLQIFTEAYIMTEGGPVDSTLFYAYYLFKQAFQFFRMGYASALAWILFVVVLGLTLLQLGLSKRWVHYDQT
jgi:multiple sugar transport system permease protein